MSKTNRTIIIAVGVIIVIVLAVLWFFTRATVYSVDTTLSGNNIIAAGEKVVIKNGAKLTVEGNYTIDGVIKCAKGPLSLEVSGDFLVNGKIECERGEELPEGGNENGVSIVAKGSIEFSSTATIISNSHVQVVDDAEKLATTAEELDEIYADAAKDDGEGLRVGPFIPIELAPGQVAYVPPVINDRVASSYHESTESNLLTKVRDALIPSVSAAGTPGRDLEGNLVDNTVKIGGTWYMGNPKMDPPHEIDVPTPPKDVKRIVLNFNFGTNGNVLVDNLTLFGPDGRPGDSEEDTNCTAVGKTGENAMRFRILANNLTINNFDLYLGHGGEGGHAMTKVDCFPGTATGGDGGSPGNFKIISRGKFEILGTFNIVPGEGGKGGHAYAFGGHGEDGCDGEKGGDAIANAGKGGDNKKGLKVRGTVNGIGNITIESIVAGNGGLAVADSGNGGDGDDCDCDGGPGGVATATGGAGGAATSRTVASYGGDGGNAESLAGRGGDGGQCDAKGPGGNGGKGGDANAKEGKGGTGKTQRGADGVVEDKMAGSGGDGGDGCPEGKGGKGGIGDPDGEDGFDGENLCRGDEPQTSLLQPGFTLDPIILRETHIIGLTDCPQLLGPVTVSGPFGSSWEIDPGVVPRWLDLDEMGGTLDQVDTEIVEMELQGHFNCRITDFSAHEEHARIPITGHDANGVPMPDSFFDVFVEVKLR